MRYMTQETAIELASLWNSLAGKSDRLEIIAKRFSWTIPQAYMVTDTLAKNDDPNNGN